MLSPEAGDRLDAAGSLRVSVGGAEANVAVHLARLGVASRFAGAVGNDPFGWRVQATLAREGVDVSTLHFDDNRPTGLYAKDPEPSGTVPYYYRTGSAASALTRLPAGCVRGRHAGARERHPRLARPGLPGGRRVAVRRPGARVVRRQPPPRALVPRRGGHGAAASWRHGPARCSWASTRRPTSGGAQKRLTCASCSPTSELVVKDAGRAATAFRDGDRVDVSALDVVVVEPVGAGDAFAAGYLVGARHRRRHGTGAAHRPRRRLHRARRQRRSRPAGGPSAAALRHDR